MEKKIVKKTTTKKTVSPKKKIYVPKTSIAKLFKNRNKRNWTNVEELENEIVKFLDTCWETHEMQIGTGKNAKWEKIEMFIVSKGLFRAHLAVTDQNIYDWKKGTNKEHKKYSYTITQAEQMIKEQLKEQVQKINKREYTDAIKWMLGTTWKEWDKESTKDKMIATLEVEKENDILPTEINLIAPAHIPIIKNENNYSSVVSTNELIEANILSTEKDGG